MRRNLYFLSVLLVVFAGVFLGCGKGMNIDQQTHKDDSHERDAKGDSGTAPLMPETTQKLFESSDVIAYADIDNVENKIEKVGLLKSLLRDVKFFRSSEVWPLFCGYSKVTRD